MNKHKLFEQDLRLIWRSRNSKEDMIKKLEEVLNWYCKKAYRDIFIVPPSNTKAHIKYLIDEILKTTRIYAKQINSGQKHDPQFTKFFPSLMRETRLVH